MKKYRSILLILIIVCSALTGFFVYDNYFKPWKEAEKYIDKYMVEQGVSKDDISKITKEKAKRATYYGILYKVYYKDEPEYEYQYFYSDDYYAQRVNHVLLQIYDSNDNKELKGYKELENLKYPPIYLEK
ncbi:DUF3139 domain-containing protein [Paraclostridium bifermentans]|uniref:DUF3139 domain-containing protein n=1 Tax=Paraclostridium bifermentans TaxID=1490 RepID=UPI00359C7C91